MGVSSRAAWLVALGATVALSMSTKPARSQGSGSAEGSAAAEPSTDDEEAAGSGAGSALVAPAMPSAKKPWLVEHMTKALGGQPKLGRAKIGVVAVDLTSGEELFASSGDGKFNLASNTKLLTSVAALGTLGNGFRWRTAVFVQTPADDAGVVAGDLYVRGKGDPLLTTAQLDALAAEVAARGVRTIEGRLVLDTGYFDGVVEPPHFDEQPKERSGFRAPVASFGVARSALTISVVPDPGGGATVTLEPDTGGYYEITKHEVTSSADGRTRLRVEAKPKRDHIEIEVTGTIKTGEGSWEQRRRVDDPGRFAAEVFKRALADHGVTFKQKAIGSGPVPVTAKQIAVHESQPLPDVLRFMNKASDNYVAESVLKTMGAESRATPGPASWADGLATERSYLATIGLAAGSYRAENGSGLFASTEVSPKQIVTLLAAAYKNYRIGPDLVQSLPIGGVDGTLAKRWKGHPAQGRVRAKTGTLDKVVTIAGYVAADTGHQIAFAILLNDVPTGHRPEARALMDEMVDVLAAYLGAG